MILAPISLSHLDLVIANYVLDATSALTSLVADVDDDGGGIAAKGKTARRHLVKNCSQGEHVGPRDDLYEEMSVGDGRWSVDRDGLQNRR